jgi:hypothetical protein
MDRIIPYKPAPQPPKPAPSSGSGQPAKPAPVDPSKSLLPPVPRNFHVSFLTFPRLWEINTPQDLKSAGTIDGFTADGKERSLDDFIDGLSQEMGLGWGLHIRFYYLLFFLFNTFALDL